MRWTRRQPQPVRLAAHDYDYIVWNSSRAATPETADSPSWTFSVPPLAQPSLCPDPAGHFNRSDCFRTKLHSHSSVCQQQHPMLAVALLQQLPLRLGRYAIQYTLQTNTRSNGRYRLQYQVHSQGIACPLPPCRSKYYSRHSPCFRFFFVNSGCSTSNCTDFALSYSRRTTKVPPELPP